MKIFSVDKIRNADQYTIAHEPVRSIDLMERAATRLLQWITAHNPSTGTPFHIFCGPGNNGGDGLALSRLLLSEGYTVSTWVTGPEKGRSADMILNLQRLQEVEGRQVSFLNEDAPLPSPTEGSIIIDGLFGSGLTRPLTGWYAMLISHLNKLNRLTIAIDIPSGLFADQHTPPSGATLRADHTLSFQFPKLAFLLPENDVHVGDWHVVDIGLHADYINRTETNNFLLTGRDAASHLMTRPRYAHKGTFGHALIISGSKGKMGAAVLAVRAALRSGAGLVHAHVPQWGATIMQTTCPEAMLSIDGHEELVTQLPKLEMFNALGMGPGVGTAPPTRQLLKQLIQTSRMPLVLDADALNILSEEPTWISFLPPHSILTPHPKEFERLFGPSDNDFIRLEKLREKSVRHQLFIILKGAHTAVACPDGHIYFNSTGNPGMATGGSGDVLTGLITGLMASGYGPATASVLGVFIHGYAGDLAAQKLGMEAMTAMDITRYLGKAFQKLHKQKRLP